MRQWASLHTAIGLAIQRTLTTTRTSMHGRLELRASMSTTSKGSATLCTSIGAASQHVNGCCVSVSANEGHIPEHANVNTSMGGAPQMATPTNDTASTDLSETQRNDACSENIDLVRQLLTAELTRSETGHRHRVCSDTARRQESANPSHARVFLISIQVLNCTFFKNSILECCFDGSTVSIMIKN